MKLVRSAFVAVVLGVSMISVAAFANPSAPKAEKKCTPDGKDCSTGDNCKPENCKKH